MGLKFIYFLEIYNKIINIKSPTCLEGIQSFDNSNPAKQVIDWAEGYFC